MAHGAPRGWLASIASGTSTTGYALVQTRYALVYRPGQGSLTRITALFAAPVTNNKQLTGCGNPESAYYFGYNGGATFGILHVTGGTRPIQTLTITTKSSTAQNVTVTIDGVGVLVAVTNGASTVTTAWEIAKGDFTQAGQGWDAQALGSIVYFVARQCNTPVGTVALTAATAVGVGAVLAVAVATTDTFVAQSAWNGDTLDGTENAGNPSGMLLDPTKGNVYAIAFQYLGFGAAFFSVESQTTGTWITVHTIRNANTRTSTVLRQPAVSPRWISANSGNGSSVSIQGASASAFIEGAPHFTGPRFSKGVPSLGISANTLTPIMSIMAMRAYQNRACRGQVRISFTSFSGDGSRPTTFFLYRDGVLAGTPSFVAVNANTSFVAVDTSATGISGGVEVFSTNVGQTGNSNTNITELDIILVAGEIMTVAALSIAANTVGVTIAWQEE